MWPTDIATWVQSAYNLVAAFAILTAGIWALRHYWREKPFEPNLCMNLDASAIRLDSNLILLHLELTYTNTGKAHFEVANSIQNPVCEEKRSFFKVFAFKPSPTIRFSSKPHIDWQKDDEILGVADIIYDGWFPDTPRIVQEPGETEIATLDLLIDNNVQFVNAWIKIWEDKDDAYFWSTSKVFSIEKLLR